MSKDMNYNEVDGRVDAFSSVCRPIYFISLRLCLPPHATEFVFFVEYCTFCKS